MVRFFRVMTATTNDAATARRWLWFALALGALLRLGLSFQGGQFYFPDEGRFFRSVLLYRSALEGDGALFARALAAPQHAGFTLLGALAAGPAHLLAWLAGTGNWSQAIDVRASGPWIAAVLNGFGLLNIALTHRLVRANGGDATEAGLAALFVALAASLTYHARHLLPYDAALTFALVGLVVAAEPARPLRQGLAGAAAGFSFTIYNGYWFIVPVVLLATVQPEIRWRGRLQAAMLAGLGAVAAIIIVMLPGAIAGGADYGNEFAAFSGTVTQGLFAEGWSLPWAYWRAAEGVFGLALLLLCGGLAIGGGWPARVRRWAGLAVLLYLLLVLGSTVLEKFVVYGRSVRPLTLLFCLLAAAAAARIMRQQPRWLLPLTSLVVLLGVLNLAPHFRLNFPEDVKAEVWASSSVPKFGLSLSGVALNSNWPPVTAPTLLLQDAAPLYPVLQPLPTPPGSVRQTWRHPQTLGAYNFEGHTPRERALLLAHPPTCRLIELADPAVVPDHPAASTLFQPRDMPDGYDRQQP